MWNDNLHVQCNRLPHLGGIETPIYVQHPHPKRNRNTRWKPSTYVEVDRVEFTPSGGTFHDGYKFDAGPYFAMDNVTVNEDQNREPGWPQH